MRSALDSKTINRILDLKKQGLKNIEIARAVGCGRDSVRKYVELYADAYGVDCRTIPEKVTDLWNKGYTANEIAKALYLSPSCVRSNIVKIGLREKRAAYAGQPDAFKKEMPPLVVKPQTDIFYPDRDYEVKKYKDRGKRYFDVSEVYGL